MQLYLFDLIERLITNWKILMNPVCILTNSFKILLLLLLLKLVHPVSQVMLLIVSPMILVLLYLLSYLLTNRSLKTKISLIQLILHLLRIFLLLLLLKKSIHLYLLFPIGLKRKIKLILRRWERISLKSKSTFFYSMLFSKNLHMLDFYGICVQPRELLVSLKRLF